MKTLFYNPKANAVIVVAANKKTKAMEQITKANLLTLSTANLRTVCQQITGQPLGKPSTKAHGVKRIIRLAKAMDISIPDKAETVLPKTKTTGLGKGKTDGPDKRKDRKGVYSRVGSKIFTLCYDPANTESKAAYFGIERQGRNMLDLMVAEVGTGGSITGKALASLFEEKRVEYFPLSKCLSIFRHFQDYMARYFRIDKLGFVTVSRPAAVEATTPA